MDRGELRSEMKELLKKATEYTTEMYNLHSNAIKANKVLTKDDIRKITELSGKYSECLKAYKRISDTLHD